MTTGSRWASCLPTKRQRIRILFPSPAPSDMLVPLLHRTQCQSLGSQFIHKGHSLCSRLHFHSHSQQYPHQQLLAALFHTKHKKHVLPHLGHCHLRRPRRHRVCWTLSFVSTASDLCSKSVLIASSTASSTTVATERP